MEIHNTTEDIVFAELKKICDFLEHNDLSICICDQCRLDAACYALNRSLPHYVVSNRGVARIEQETIERQQKKADITALIHEALQRVSHNQRPLSNQAGDHEAPLQDVPVFNIPTIVGRLFNGINFAPMADIDVELFREGKLVTMKDRNWQNPYRLVPNTQGTFTFWPSPVPAAAAELRQTFEYSVKITVPGFEELIHFFTIPVIGEIHAAGSYSMDRTFKLPDLYIFPPENDNASRYLS